jgi:hypothetical protein
VAQLSVLLLYLLIAAGGVRHEDLFSPVNLPFLNIDLPLKGFFILGPSLFLIVHAYVLLHFAMLSSKVGAFDQALRDQIKDVDIRTCSLIWGRSGCSGRRSPDRTPFIT